MLRDNLVGLIEPMFSSAGAHPLALPIARQKSSDDRPPCLENPRPEGAESTLTENAPSPFQAEPRHYAELQKLDAQEQNELRRLIRSGRITVGPPILERIATKTDFIYRDVSGEWRVERQHERFLKHWDKTNKT
jgi:hypothetical protein